ncbi:MAG: 30S ribosomal protein S5 alanine N-acetyltransferase [Micavibrio sp.]|nr:30S ribosomal protein S5 alanine N-acetyltransferase [Micavibrio sp.]|tara:strand:- start:3441 stop:4043 length:603 start_codon:yes stop_codon:yes gene_type:complete
MFKTDNAALPDIELQTQRMILRPPKALDWGQWADVRGTNQRRLKPYEPLWAPDALSGNFFKRRLARQIRDWEQNRAQSFLMVRQTDDQLIGGVNINNICHGAAQFASLGYWVCHSVEGQGFMSEALLRIIDYCFHDLKLHRLNAACIPDNERSKALLLRNGFVEEGFAKHYLKINGRWQDHVLFGLTQEHFQETPALHHR